MHCHRAAALIILGLVSAAPAGAQIVGRPQYERVSAPDPFLGNGYIAGPGLGSDLRDIDRRIDRARDNGMITRREARQLRREARAIAHLGGVYRRGGLSTSERLELRTRVSVLRDSITRQPPASSAGDRGH
jgi:hypothetical protein